VAAFVLVLTVQAVWPEGKGEPVAWADLSTAVGPLPLTRETKRVFRSEAQLASSLARLESSGRAPRVDFTRRQLLLVSPGPRSSTGYGVEIVRVRRHGDRIDVVVRERAPSLGTQVNAGVNSPYRLLSLPRNGDVYVDWRGR
jgi:protease stability complex PrcB-like protein